jgi:pimeloyl-ACP methyl ester carboxylesterase
VTLLDEPRFEGSVRLRDGRRLGFAEFGPATGRPVLWFHGTPGARRQIAPEARRLAHEQSVRIVCVERPGIGESTPHAYRAVVDFARDVEQLCTALALDRFAVVGLSGGGPYALACAHEMPERVAVVAVLGGVVPAVGRDAARGGANDLIRMFAPMLERGWRPLGAVMSRLVRVLERWADPATDLFARAMPPGDQAVFADRATRRMFQEDLLVGAREHMDALWLDARLFGRSWGFDLRDVRVPTLLRYGDADTIVPLVHGEHLARRLPNAELRVYAGEGHVGSLGASREIFDFLLERWS